MTKVNHCQCYMHKGQTSQVQHYDDGLCTNTFEVFHCNAKHEHIGHLPSLTMACDASNPELWGQLDKLAAMCLGKRYFPTGTYRVADTESGLVLELENGEYIFATCDLH